MTSELLRGGADPGAVGMAATWESGPKTEAGVPGAAAARAAAARAASIEEVRKLLVNILKSVGGSKCCAVQTMGGVCNGYIRASSISDRIASTLIPTDFESMTTGVVARIG